MEEQNNDPELADLFKRVLSESSASSYQICFYLKSDVLMKKYRPVDWLVIHEVVVPKVLRGAILSLAHEGAAGHLGVRKTYQKILQHFFWPKIKRDVAAFCRCYHVCQVGDKTKHDAKSVSL